MKETCVIVEYEKKEFENKLNRFINNGWQILNSNLIIPNKLLYKEKPEISEIIIPNTNNLTNTVFYALLIKES